METTQLRDMSLGGLAAEHDVSLESYFFETRMFRRARLGHTKILIGNRGSGKSAVFKILAKSEQAAGTLVMPVIPNDYLYELLKNVREIHVNAEWALQGAYTASWKYVILISAIKLLHQKYRNLKTNKEAYGLINVFLKENYQEFYQTPLDVLVDLIKKFGNITKVTLEGIEFDRKASQLEQFYKLEKLKNVIPAVQELSRDTKVMFLFDELDQGWDASDDARHFITGLFKAAVYINQNFPNLNVLITIREEIYRKIPELYDDAQKIRDLVEYIRWTPEELKTMITRRIQYALEMIIGSKLKGTDENRIWETIFHKFVTKNRIPSFQYLVERTLNRPRELIFFINECLKAHNFEEKIGDATIETVEKYYSKTGLEDIASEYRFQYPGLREVFETFRLSHCFWSREKLEEHWLDIVEGKKMCPGAAAWLNPQCTPEQFIEILWLVGFLRAFITKDDDRSAEKERYYVGYYEEPTLNIALVHTFCIHPMFRAHLVVE